MSRCCHNLTAPKPARWLHPAAEIVRWIVPTALLALTPKCPACLVAFVAIGTGISLSAPVAAWLRLLLATLCAVSLSYLMGQRLAAFLAPYIPTGWYK